MSLQKKRKRKHRRRLRFLPRKEKMSRNRQANSHLRTLSVVLISCCALACANILYVMVTHKHIWSQHDVIDPHLQTTHVTSTLYGQRGTIYDRTDTVLAQDEPAWTAIIQFETGMADDSSETDQNTDDSADKQNTDSQDTDQQSSTEKQRDSSDQPEDSEKETGSDRETSPEKEKNPENQDSQKDSQQSSSDSSSDGSSGSSSSEDSRDSSEEDKNKVTYCKDPAKAAKAIKEVLGGAVDEKTLKSIIQNAMDSGRTQTELGTGTKRLSEETKKELEAKNIDGLAFLEVTARDYPHKPLSSTLLGYAYFDEDQQRYLGGGGLEGAMDSYLGSTDGMRTYQQTKAGYKLPGTETIEKPKNGYDVHLTIDATLQQTVDEQMQKTMDENKASKAWCLVMEVETGKILAWSSVPGYDQNTLEGVLDSTDNIAQMTYEPGSVMKPFVYATAIDTGVYPYNATYRAGEFVYTEDSNGKIVRLTDGDLSGYPVIRDALGTDYGTLTFSEGLAHSSNIAICELLANYLNRTTFNDYLDKFGFFKNVNIDFILESTGVRNTASNSGYLSTGFGQASSVTPLQLCQAYTAIFNDGVMMKPYVVESITDPETGKVIQEHEPEEAGRPISANTARQVTDIMKTVLDTGMSGERFAMEGVDLAAKTGTGEVYDTELGTYSTVDFTSSIMAAAPASDPKVMVYWGMISPNYLNYSESYFQTIMRAALIAANENGGTTEADEEDYDSWQSYTMPSLTNHSTDFASSEMEGMDINTVVLGDGKNIIDQYPKAGTAMGTGDNVLLLTDGKNITMPNIIGWTRKDVTALWQMTGISVSYDGDGRVSWQSIDPDTVLTDGAELSVTLSNAGGQ